jgi:hypothetical protein
MVELMRGVIFGFRSIGVRDSFGRLVRREIGRGGDIRFLVRNSVRLFGFRILRCVWMLSVFWAYGLSFVRVFLVSSESYPLSLS